MTKNGEHDFSLAAGLRALALMTYHAPVDVAGFARLNSVSEEQARRLILTYENCGYARRTSLPDIYEPTQLAVDLVGQVGPAERLN